MKKVNIPENEAIKCMIVAAISFIGYELLSFLWRYVESLIFRQSDVFVALDILIAWLSLTQMMLGILLGIIAIPIIITIVSPLLGLEIFLEKKLRVARPVKLDKKPKFSYIAIFLYGYILFGPVVILTKMLTTVGSMEMIIYYIIAVDYMRKFMPLILIILVSAFMIRDMSSIRHFKDNLTLSYPSRFLQFILIFIVGMGSIATLVPMYYELLSIFHDRSLALKLFIYAILLGYMPSLAMTIGYMISLLLVGRYFFDKALELLENILLKYANVEEIGIYPIRGARDNEP